MSPTGLIDLHSHLLPGIDDGCRTIAESLTCVRTLLDHGFTGTVCTPHMAIRDFAENIPVNIAEHVAVLQEQLHAAELEYQLWAGGELRIDPDTISWLREHGVPTLGASRNVLIDYWGTQWPHYADAVVEHLLQDGFHPILAHPERMDFEDGEWEAVLRRLEQNGVWLQGNLKCLAGREGPRGRRAGVAFAPRGSLSIARHRHAWHAGSRRSAGGPDSRRAAVRQHATLQKLLADSPQAIVAPAR